MNSSVIPRNNARRWAWISAAILIVLSPFLLFPGGWKTWALVGLPLIWLGNRLFTGHFVRRTPLDVVLLCLLVMVLVSLYATYDLSLSLPKVTGVLLGVSAFYVLVNLADTPLGLRQMLIGLLIVLTLFVGLALVGTNWVRKIPVLQQVSALLPSALRGLPGAVDGFHPAEVGGTLTWLIFLPAALAIGLWPQRRYRRVQLMLLGLVGLCGAMSLTLVLTQSRSAWMGVAFGAAVLLWLLGRWGRSLLLLGIIGATLVVVLVGPDRLISAETARPAANEFGTILNLSLSDRVGIWSRAQYTIQDFPLTGVGLGMFRYVMPVLYPLFTISPELDLGHAHNEWLQAGVDLGFPGLIVFVALQGLALGLAYRSFRDAAEPALRWLMAGALAGLMAHGFFALTDAVALGAKPSLFLWLLLALIAGTWIVSHGTPARPLQV